MGAALAKKVVSQLGKDHGIDVIVPVPDTSRVSALQLSYKLNVPYREGNQSPIHTILKNNKKKDSSRTDTLDALF